VLPRFNVIFMLQVVCTATDKAGNEQQCSFTIVVSDQADAEQTCVGKRPIYFAIADLSN